MVSLVAASGDLFLATGRTRVTLDHLRKRLRFRPYVSPDPLLEDLEGQAAMLHPAHVRTCLVIPREPLDECLADLVWQTVQLLVNCPPPENRVMRSRARGSGKKRSRLVTDTKRPFVFGPTDYLAIVRIKPVHGRGEIVGVLGRNQFRLGRRKDSRLPSSSLPLFNPSNLLAVAGINSDSDESAAALPWLRC